MSHQMFHAVKALVVGCQVLMGKAQNLKHRPWNISERPSAHVVGWGWRCPAWLGPRGRAAPEPLHNMEKNRNTHNSHSVCTRLPSGTFPGSCAAAPSLAFSTVLVVVNVLVHSVGPCETVV